MKSLIQIPEKMDALVLHAINNLSYEKVDVPELTEGCVLVQIKACGICSSDVERVFVNGTYHFPTIIGHEFSGQIVAVGDGVDEALLGRKTCVFPLLPCKTCKACQMQEWAQCSGYSYFGSRCDGGFSQYLVVPTWNLVLFDDSIEYKTAALCEPSAVSIHAVNIGKIKSSDTVAVIGTGTIGLLIALFAKKQAKTVVVCGRNDVKLDFAKSLGLETVKIGEGNIADEIEKVTGSKGADVTFEVVGSNAAIQTSIEATGALGTVVLVGNPKSDLELPQNVYWSILRKQITVAGSWNSNYNDKINDWKATLELFKDVDVPFGKMVTHVYSMSEADEAFAMLTNKDEFSIKAMFSME